MGTEKNPESKASNEGARGPQTTRRGLLQGVTGAAAVATMMAAGAKAVRADGNIGFYAQDIPNDKLVEMYTTLLRIRWHERMTADKALTDPKFRANNHLYAGQEAVATGVIANLRNKGSFNEVDLVFGTHRSAGHAIAKGVDMKRMCAEMDYRATGLNHGFAAEMHMSDRSCGFIGADGIVGPGAVIASGAAVAMRARGSKQVAVVFAGDGTYATPAFHSSLNNASLLKLPFIYVLENNLYHQYAHYSYSCPMKDIAEAAKTYRIPGVVVDGQDVLQVYNVAHEAVERARAGAGPTLIEAKTYRYYSHWGAPGATAGQLGSFGYDPGAITSFRPEREVRAWLARDPVDINRKALISWGVLTQAQADEIEAGVRKEITEALAWSDQQPLCKPEDGLKNVYVEGTVIARQLA